MNLDIAKNFVRADVSTGYDASATSITLAAGKGSIFPDPATAGSYNLVWKRKDLAVDEDNNIEIVRVTARSSDNLTFTRGQEGTVPSTKNDSGKTYEVFLSPTAKMFTDINTELAGKAKILGVYKTANETINNSTTYQDDDHLSLTIEANAVYQYELVCMVQQSGGATAGFKAQFTAPSGATAYSHVFRNASSNYSFYLINQIDTLVINSDSGVVTGSGDYNVLKSNGIIINGASDGNLVLQWAQASAQAGINTILLKGSYLILTRIA